MTILRIFTLFLFMAPAFLTGCVTYPDQRSQVAMQEREDMLLIREDLRRVRGQLEGMELELERVHRDLATLQADQARGTQNTDTRVSHLERRIQEVDRARESDKKEIVESLTRTVDQLVRSQAASRTQRSGRHSGFGYEHTVGPGETLSHIAAAYGVTTRAIIEANNLKNPDVVRAGQVLFIPE